MRILNAAVGAALLILVASPALAGDPRGGGHGGGHGGGGCGGSCGGGGHPPPPPPPPPPPHGGGYNGNINVNVNANANAYAGASAGAYVNARTYDMGGFRGGGGSYGAVYVGGGYGGDGGYYGGGAIYNEEVYEGRVCASAPFGYVVGGFGRNGRRAPACVANTGGCRDDHDRGGRYGYSERHSCPGSRREERGSYEESGSSSHYRSYESREEYREETAYSGGYGYVGYDRGRGCGGGCDSGYTPPPPPPPHDCGCDHDDGYDAPYPPPYTPEPPRHYAPDPAPPSYPRPSPRPRQEYRQEPGERG